MADSAAASASFEEDKNLLKMFEEGDFVEKDAPELVHLRLKPSIEPSSSYEVHGDQCLITSVDTAPASHGHRTQHNLSKTYTVTHGPESNQKGTTQAFVRSGEEAYDVMVTGKHDLQVHATEVHAHSSRSQGNMHPITETESGVRESHELQLAAGARDIQMNNTISEPASTLETSCSQEMAEMTRLKMENEFLRRKIAQVKALIQKIIVAQDQQKNVVTVKELVKQARVRAQECFKQHMSSMEEYHVVEAALLKEFEAKLNRTMLSRALQEKVMSQTRIAILEEAINAQGEVMAREAEEVQQLMRAYIKKMKRIAG